MLKICVDTSYLISFADPERPNHSTAVDYFRHCVANGYLLCLSTLVVSEFEVGQPASDLPLQHFHIVPFNYRHAVRSADYHKVIKGLPAPDSSFSPRTRIPSPVGQISLGSRISAECRHYCSKRGSARTS
jgi:hypothetical protein